MPRAVTLSIINPFSILSLFSYRCFLTSTLRCHDEGQQRREGAPVENRLELIRTDKDVVPADPEHTNAGSTILILTPSKRCTKCEPFYDAIVLDINN